MTGIHAPTSTGLSRLWVTASRRAAAVTGGGGTAGAAWFVPAAAAVVVRPGLWGIALRQLRALAEPGWVRRRPHLPLPPAAYLRFRLLTAYGDPEATPSPADVVGYLSWCRDEQRRRPRHVAAPRVRRAGNRPLQARAGQ